MASAAQYVLLGGFAAVAAGISAQGLTGFARENMDLHGAWPYLLFFALDGAAGVCAVLLTRRAARAESAVAPRLAVWGLVIASSSFNWTHAPHHPGAPDAFGLMPVIAAVLFEFTLHELRLRTAGRADRRLTALRWLHPAEYIHVQFRLAADDQVSAEAATRSVRVGHAARRLHVLRRALHAQDQAAGHNVIAARRARFAERRAHAALTRAHFADPPVAAEVLRQVQVLTLTPELARLDYAAAEAVQTAIANMITTTPSTALLPAHNARSCPPYHGGAPQNGSPASQDDPPASREDEIQDGHLVAAATRILAEARTHGERLSQKTLGGKLRGEGYRVANHSLRKLMTAGSPLNTGHHPVTGRPPPPEMRPSSTGALPGQPAASPISDHPLNGAHPAVTIPASPPQRSRGTPGLPGD